MSKTLIENSFQQLYRKPCWGLHFDSQLNLSMNFGKPSLRIREPFSTASKLEVVRRMAARRCVTVRGEWWLWIYCSFWRLSTNSTLLATSSSSSRRIERALKQLDGEALEAVTVNPATGATKFIFDLGCALECRRFERDSDAELWMLYKPRGYVLSARGNGTFTHERASQAGHQARPIA